MAGSRWRQWYHRLHPAEVTVEQSVRETDAESSHGALARLCYKPGVLVSSASRCLRATTSTGAALALLLGALGWARPGTVGGYAGDVPSGDRLELASLEPAHPRGVAA